MAYTGGPLSILDDLGNPDNPFLVFLPLHIPENTELFISFTIQQKFLYQLFDPLN